MPLNVELLAKTAMNHVLELVHASGTSPETNDLSPEKQMSVWKLMKELRNLEDKRTENLHQGNLFNLIKDPISNNFELTILDINKFLVANCQEMAMLALDYILHKDLDCQVEILIIDGNKNEGSEESHVVAVLNRDPSSDPKRPETWGDAWICDPWSKSVYSLQEHDYKDMFVVQYYDEQEHKHKVRKFNSDVDTLSFDIYKLSDLRKELN